MKKYIKPCILQAGMQLEGFICESTPVDVNPGDKVDAGDIDANENNSFWDDEN